MIEKFLKAYSDFFETKEFRSEYAYLQLNNILRIKIGSILAFIVIILSVVAFRGVTNTIHQNNVKSSENAKKAAFVLKKKEKYKKQHFQQVKNDVEATMAKTEDDHMREVGNVDESKKAELKAPVDDDIKTLKSEIKQLDKMPKDDDVVVLKTSIDNKLNLLN